MSRNEISIKTRRLADMSAREKLGLEGLRVDEMTAIQYRSLQNERRTLAKIIDKNETYYTAADFQFS